MNRVHPLRSSSSTSTSKLYSTRTIDNTTDDLAALEKSVRLSSFALLPSALTPSRAPSNTLIASSRAVFCKPMHLEFPFGLDKGPIIDWYKRQQRRGSTTIDKLQLRKDHQNPYFHEYIVVFTKGGHIYRVDRRPDADAPFNTIMKVGCTAFDTIEEVLSTSLEELDKTSDCVVELIWGGKQTIDLLYVLSICFGIHTDKLAKRYTLQHYNCYFLSWTIVLLTMRKTATWGTGLHAALKRGVHRGVNRCVHGQQLEYALRLGLEGQLGWDLGWGLSRELARELGLVLGRTLSRELKPVLKTARVHVRQWVLELTRNKQSALDYAADLEFKLERERIRMQERVRVQELELELKLATVLEREREWNIEQMLRPDTGRLHNRERELKLALERARERAQRLEEKREEDPQLEGKLGLKLDQVRSRLLEAARDMAKELARELAQVPLILGQELAQGWKDKLENVPNKLQELLGDADAMFFPSELGRKRTWLRNSVSRIVMNMLEAASKSERPRLAESPASFSISINNKYLDHIKSNAAAPGQRKLTPPELEKAIIHIVNTHAERIDRWGLGSGLGSKGVKSVILGGMWRIWQVLSPLPLDVYILQESKRHATKH